MPRTFIHDPQAVLDYKLDWSDWLGADTIASATWTVPSGLTQTAASNTTTTATVWLSEGTAGNSYSVVSTIVTADGRTDERTIILRVQHR